MKATNNIFSLWLGKVGVGLVALCAIGFSSCEKPVEPEQKDWDGTTTYFASTDEKPATTYYAPYVGFVGDPMPFFDAKTNSFKVLYLQEYRPNPATTFHPFWGMETKDVAHYDQLSQVLPTGSATEQDAHLGTGCVVYSEAEQLYYIYYTGERDMPKAGEDVQVVMRATSPDFKTWTKDPLFRLRGIADGYSSQDFRDPCIFFADDLWHMVISTRVGGKGNLAEYTSPDLKEWTHAGVFMPMMWDRFYECPDVFQMGDWWYLVYSELSGGKGKEWGRHIQYFKGHSLAELKACTAGDAGIWPDDHEGFLDSRGLYAGKTAGNAEERYLWGWCPTREGNDNTKTNPDGEPQWAGSLVAHRLIQHADGSLTLGEVPGIKEKYNVVKEVKAMLTEDTYTLYNRLGYHNHISLTVEAEGKFGISFVRGSDSEKWYTLVVNPEDGGAKRKINFEEEGPKGAGFIGAIDSYKFNKPADNIYHINIYTDNSVVVMYINDCLAYTNRIYGVARNCWSINNYGNPITVSDIQLTQY